MGLPVEREHCLLPSADHSCIGICRSAFLPRRLRLMLGENSDRLEVMNAPVIAAPSLTAEEMQSRRQAHEDSRHSLRLEGLDGFLTSEDDSKRRLGFGARSRLKSD